jgi:hypothetical protein
MGYGSTMTTDANGDNVEPRRVLAEALTEHADELVADIMRPDREGIRRHWLDIVPAADMLIEALSTAGYRIIPPDTGRRPSDGE